MQTEHQSRIQDIYLKGIKYKNWNHFWEAFFRFLREGIALMAPLVSAPDEHVTVTSPFESFRWNNVLFQKQSKLKFSKIIINCLP